MKPSSLIALARWVVQRREILAATALARIEYGKIKEAHLLGDSALKRIEYRLYLLAKDSMHLDPP
jgi:hypothetical protein